MNSIMERYGRADKMNTKRTFTIIGLSAALVVALLSVLTLAGTLDIIGRWSVPAFEAALENMPANVSEEPTYGGWAISAPDSSARFIIRSTDAVKEGYDLTFVIDAAPFIAAGADATKLPGTSTTDGRLYIGKDVDDASDGRDAKGPAEAYAAILRANRSGVKYHAEMGHFGISLGGGNMFEWAKELRTNDKDIVFVLNPEPFKEAGADLNSIEGWILAKIAVMDEKGRMVPVDKLVKPINLM